MKQTDIYTQALTCLRSILQTDHPEFKNWIDWLEQDIEDWTQRREVAHHLRVYGGMGSFNDLPNMQGNHDYIFGFLKSVCYTCLLYTSTCRCLHPAFLPFATHKHKRLRTPSCFPQITI